MWRYETGGDESCQMAGIPDLTVIPSYMLSGGMKRIGANNAAIVTSVGPASTILQAHWELGDPIFIEQVVGTVLVIVGVLLIGWKAG